MRASCTPLPRRPSVLTCPRRSTACSQQCLAKRPEHRPSSALELARALQRIESNAGWSRTAVAVEGDRPDSSVAVPDRSGPPEDATAMKPVTVISASGQRRIAAQDPTPTPSDEGVGGGVSGLVWAGVGVALLALLVGFLVFRGDGREEDPGVVVPTGSITPSDLVPDDLDAAPSLSGRRTARGVLFQWEPPVPVEPGDSFSWHRDDTDEYGSTTRKRLLVRTDQPVCLDLRMKRGSDNSPSSNQCVS